MANEPNSKNGDVRPFQTGKLLYAFAYLGECWERAWPLLVWLFSLACIYAAVSWFGIWHYIEDLPRYGLIGLFAIAAIFSLRPLRLFSLPTSDQLYARIEKASHLENRPVTAQVDEVANSSDEYSSALWAEHKKRMAEQLENLSSGTPKPNAHRFDRYAIRAFLPIIAFVAWGFSHGPTGGRLLDGIFPQIDKAAILSRLDVWVNSPTYTGTPPLYLSERKQAENEIELQAVTVLEGSIFNLRYIGEEEVNARYKIGDVTTTIDPDLEAKEYAFAYEIKEAGSIELFVDEEVIASWPVATKDDQSPSIAFEATPKSALSGSLELTYSVEDDYGVVSARGIVKSLEELDPNARPLVDAPELQLSLPRSRAKSGSAKVNRDLTSHPWALSEVEITLEATDDPGQTGLSEPFKINLPGRLFTDPMALALIEERRILALDANKSGYVADLLDAVTQFPEEFKIDTKAYVALRVAYRMISDAESDDKLRDAMAILWDTALALEYGDLSEVERKLREAQEKLSDALENGVNDEELQKLMDELRQAMNEYIEELQKQMAKNPNMQNPMDNFDRSQTLTQRDLEKMMDQIEDLAKSGSKDAARQMLSEMQRMMDNLRAGQHQQQQQAEGNQMNQTLDKLSELMDKQQQLMDESFNMQRNNPNNQQRRQQQGQQEQSQQGQQQQNQQGQQQQGENGEKQPGQNGEMSQEEFDEAMRGLQERQDALQKQLGQLGKELEDLGLDPSKEFGEAGREMGEASGNLGEGQAGEAAGDQGQALQALRQGAQSMMQQMAGDRGQGGGQQQGQAGQGQGQRQGSDPLGRSKEGNSRFSDGQTKVPSEIDAQRAREIMDAIRKRLSNPLRPSIERKYLERLLEVE